MNMKQWKDVTETYQEICGVMDELEISVFSPKTGPYEIYVSYGKMYGIVYSDEHNAYKKRDEMKKSY